MHELKPVEDWIKERSLGLDVPPVLLGYYTDEYTGGITLKPLSEDRIWMVKSENLASLIDPAIVFYHSPSPDRLFMRDTPSAYSVWLVRASTKIATRSRRGTGNWLIPCRSGMMMVYAGESLADSPALYDHEQEKFMVNSKYLSNYFCFMPGNPAEMFRELTRVIGQFENRFNLVENGYM